MSGHGEYSDVIAAAAAPGAHASGHELQNNGFDQCEMGDGMGDADHAGDGDKPLTSRYRGVCWNKKNRRWQAAINSSGKYIYLGSFLGEEEAARMFDRAAIRLRGARAKLNFDLGDYTDEQGELREDPRINSIIFKAGDSNAGAQPVKPRHNSTVPGLPQTSAADVGHHVGSQHQHQHGGNGGNPPPSYSAGQGGLPVSNGPPGLPRSSGPPPGSFQPKFEDPGSGRSFMAAAQQGSRTGSLPGASPVPGLGRAPPPGGYTVPANAFKGKAINVLDVPLPPGCSLEATVKGEEDAFGILYLDPDRLLGAVIWDGFASQDLGVYDTDRDARTACNSALRIVLQYKSQNALLLQSLAESMLPPAPSSAPPPAHHRAPSPSLFTGGGPVMFQLAENAALDAGGGLDGPAGLPRGLLQTHHGKPQQGATQHGGSHHHHHHHHQPPAGQAGTAAVPGGYNPQQYTGTGAGTEAAANKHQPYSDLFFFLSNCQQRGGKLEGGSGGAVPSPSDGGDGGDPLAMPPPLMVGRPGANSGAGAGMSSGSPSAGLALMKRRLSEDAAAAANIGTLGKRPSLTYQASHEQQQQQQHHHHQQQQQHSHAMQSQGGGASLHGSLGIPSEFSQMKSLANVSVQEVMKQLMEQKQQRS